MAIDECESATIPEVFVTDRFLTHGILRVKNMVRTGKSGILGDYITDGNVMLELGRDAFLVLEDAQRDARERIATKSALNEKWNAKLRALSLAARDVDAPA